MHLVPDASVDDGLLDVVLISGAGKRAYLANLAKVFRGTHVHDAAYTRLQAREVTLLGRPALHRLRRRRPDRRPARHLPRRPARPARARPVTEKKGQTLLSRLGVGVAAAKAVGRLSRAAGRGGGTSLPGKVLTRVEPDAIGMLSGRLAHGSAVISATNGKTTTAAMVASVLERRGARLVHNRAGANMAGRRRQRARLRARATPDCSRSTSSGSRSCSGELEPRAVLLANLFRDQLDRYGELETIGDRWAEAVRTLPPRHRRSSSTPTIR